MSPQHIQRFRDEAENMDKLNGIPGVLPVWDVDRDGPNAPRWYAMPQARLLDDQLGDDATLREVVEQIAFVADTLTGLARMDIFHRDVKPGNLLWWDGHPVLADFGIAAWGGVAQPGLTREGEKLGPANFIAPEMRHRNPSNPGKHADVYSLAKTLFVLAVPDRGPYPPDGTHRADGYEFSLWEAGGDRALPALRHVLEAATEFDVHRRLRMADFRDELRAWLWQYSDVTFRPRRPQSRPRSGWESVRNITERIRRDREATRTQMIACIQDIAEALTGDSDKWIDGDQEEDGIIMLGDYDWEPNSEDGFEPESVIQLATQTQEGRRIVLEAVLDGRVCFVAESQTDEPRWTLERQWNHTDWFRPRMPRSMQCAEQLTDEIVAFVASTKSANPPNENKD